MLEAIGLENFKGFDNLPSLSTKPITILCGPNSCGKSTILQSLLLFKQTVESKSLNQTLLLNGRFVHLGTFENIIFEKQLENIVSFNFRFIIKREDFAKRKKGKIPFFFIFRELLSEESFNSKQAEYYINYKISLKKETKPPKPYINPIIVEYLQFSIETKTQDSKIIPEAKIEMSRKERDIYEIKWANIHSRFDTRNKTQTKERKEETKILFSNLFPIGFGIQDETKETRPPEVFYSLFRLIDIFQNIFSSFTYIGPLREEPSRRYIYEDEVTEIGIKGENAAYIYTSEQDKKIENLYFFDETNNSFYKERQSLELSKALTHWLSQMGIKDFKPEPKKEIIYLNLNSGAPHKTRVNIADVGFGVSQIFPIILEGLRMERGSTLLLEQPEIHLHPNLQMKLSDYFISLALSNKKVIVETHSDHIINRLIRRITEDTDNNLRDLISIYFIVQSNKGITCEEISIDSSGGIVNWPKDFFDQTASEQENIIQAGIKKRMSAS